MIVVVEDPLISGFLRMLLSKAGYRVMLTAARPALELFRSGENRVDLLITNRPAMFAEVGDRIPLLYLSACPDEEQAAAFRLCRTLPKPFRRDQLLDAVGELAGLPAAVN